VQEATTRHRLSEGTEILDSLTPPEELSMAETVKKPKAPAKTAKPAAEKKAPAAAKSKKAATSTNKIHLMPATHEQIAALAHKYWAERGQNHGQHEEDWYRAEQELRGKAS
jgi:Protein of unknown function (DUF2934)